jgi:hypothetical protein
MHAPKANVCPDTVSENPAPEVEKSWGVSRRKSDGRAEWDRPSTTGIEAPRETHSMPIQDGFTTLKSGR